MTSRSTLRAEGWQPIETAPWNTSVLVFMPGAAQAMDIEIAHRAAEDPDGDWFPTTYDSGPLDVLPTHWMPLPEPPQ